VTKNDFKCHLNLSDVHATGTKPSEALQEFASFKVLLFHLIHFLKQ